VRFVVLLVEGDEVGEREAVVAGGEVDRRRWSAAVVLVEVAGTREPRRKLAEIPLPAPEVADAVAVLAVPLRPEHREVADLVAAGAGVPRLGGQLRMRERAAVVAAS